MHGSNEGWVGRLLTRILRSLHMWHKAMCTSQAFSMDEW